MCISPFFWCSVFFSENYCAAVVPSPKIGNTSDLPWSNVLFLSLLLSTECFCETPDVLHHADYHSLMDKICLCVCLFLNYCLL